jgi:hypothetical protein
VRVNSSDSAAVDEVGRYALAGVDEVERDVMEKAHDYLPEFLRVMDWKG